MTPMPRDWNALDKRLKGWQPPDGSFTPAGKWDMHFARHTLIPERDGTPGGAQAGALHLECTFMTKELVRLQVSELEKAGFTNMTTRAGINCAPDPLLTPRRWSLSCSWENSLKVVKSSELDQQQTGLVEGHEIIFKGAKERRCPAPARWTSFWNLFAAIQQLPFAADSSLVFDLFEAFDQYKPDQRITYAGKHPVDLGNQKMELHVFEQTGRGIMPWHWWLDDQHRVLLAAGNRRAYLLMSCNQGGVE
jgi:hypothetical protein